MKIVKVAATDFTPSAELEKLIDVVNERVYRNEHDVILAVIQGAVALIDQLAINTIRDQPITYIGALLPHWKQFIPNVYDTYYGVYMQGFTLQGESIKGTIYFVALKT